MKCRNARFWFYGDDEPTERLRILDSFLSEFEVSIVSWMRPLFEFRT